MKKNYFSEIVHWINHFLHGSRNRRLIFLILLLVVASVDLLLTPKKRYVFSFYSQKDNTLIAETRFFTPGETREGRLQHYIEEYLLGPASLDALPLFPLDASLETVMIRNDHAYINLSEFAALPVPGIISFNERARLFTEMIRRNFQSIKEISLFIAGNELYHANTEQKIKKSVDK